ncbi:MAG: hypothetical protein WCG87_01940 [Bacteroidota bacterium]
MEESFITLWDYILLPIYLVIIYVIAKRFRDRKYPEGHPLRPYFLPGLTAKIVGGLFIGMIYQYHYGGGDTSNYFYHARIINSALDEGPIKWFNMLFRIPSEYDGRYSFYILGMVRYGNWYNSPSEYIVCTLTALLCMVTFTKYLPITVLIAAISYTGIWALFRAFYSQYPKTVKPIAISVLFVPSVIMWGSGIFKDSFCMLGLGWMTYGVLRMILYRDFRLGNVIPTILSFYLISITKIYILLAFLPGLALWLMFLYIHKINSFVLRFIVRATLIPLLAGAFLFATEKFKEQLGKYSLERFAQTSYVTRNWIRQTSGTDDGSSYDLGNIDPPLSSMLKKFPAAVNVTLFRPYVWETKKPLQELSAIEALIFLWLTVKVLFAVGPAKAMKAILTDPNIQFCLIFSFIFAFAVGVSSYNFGTLSRYRIPCLPFYALAVTLIYYKYYPPEKNLFSFK